MDQAALDNLEILHYPDPVLRQVCQPVTSFGESLGALGRRMLQLMKTNNGVGLAGPQVGLTQQIFVCNHSGKPEDDLVVVNPELLDLEGAALASEGCLSIPDVNVDVRRARQCTLKAQDTDGHEYILSGSDLPARIWQHENDHLYGKPSLDYMDEASKIANRRAIKHLENSYKG